MKIKLNNTQGRTPINLLRRFLLKANILLVVCIILFVSLVFVSLQNFGLKNEIDELNETMGDVFANTLDDFNLFLIEKVEKCEAVTLMVGDESVTVNNIHCGLQK